HPETGPRGERLTRRRVGGEAGHQSGAGLRGGRDGQQSLLRTRWTRGTQVGAGPCRFAWTGAPGGDEHVAVALVRALLLSFVALEHLGFRVREMFLFKSPAGERISRTTPEFAGEAAPLAANRGLYNGFLAAGLFWSLLAPPPLG